MLVSQGRTLNMKVVFYQTRVFPLAERDMGDETT